ncbi:GNAT family N-acetyltransferase [Oscillospiraceae bacterium CM]|nr:GNAT family N-acetyltransferase [Oscillospiraceae bacterium CM]
MTTIYLIRHAEAEGNLYRRIHGQYDSLVTRRGYKQIGALKKRFADVSIDAVYSSDLTRTRLTAAAIYKNHGLDAAFTPALREVNMGVWEDTPWGEVERFEPDKLDAFNNDPTRWRVDGAESFLDLRQRMTREIEKIAACHNGQTVAVFSHGSAIRAFASGVMNVSPQEIRRVPHCDNTAVARLVADGDTMTFDYYGDNSHLPEEYSTFAHQKWWRENTTFDSTNIRFVPFDLSGNVPLYLEYRAEACDAERPCDAMAGFWLENARRHAQEHSRAVSLALIGDTPVGAIELATKEGALDNVGVIEFFYMTGSHRKTGIAVQLLGQAVSVYRTLGRERLRVAVSAHNERAYWFCAKYGFEKVREEDGPNGRHDILEMNIALGGKNLYDII